MQSKIAVVQATGIGRLHKLVGFVEEKELALFLRAFEEQGPRTVLGFDAKAKTSLSGRTCDGRQDTAHHVSAQVHDKRAWVRGRGEGAFFEKEERSEERRGGKEGGG